MAAPVPDQFDAYFRAADLNQDGKISGQEAVAFFKGSNLPQQVLAQIWTYADQNRTGFLGRPEFYNYLRLVTVAQAGRQLTPDLVKSALFGPAASKIPAPKINMPVSAPVSAPVPAPVPVQGSQETGGMGMPAQQNTGFRAVTPVQQSVPRPMGPGPSPLSQKPPIPAQNQNHQVGTAPNLSTDWFSGKRNLPPAQPVQQPVRPVQQAGPTAQVLSRGIAGLDMGLTAGEPAKDSKALVATGNGILGNGISSNPPATPSADPFAAFAPITKSTPPSVTPATRPLQSPQNQIPQNQLPPRQMMTPPGSGISAVSNAGSGVPAAQSPWPKITQSDVQKYIGVFLKVDRDRDGKITGEEARNLFLSWKLHREVLKRVWELSDQDKDGMLTFREFCTAVYLMERHREHRPLPDQLPAGIWSDGISFPSTGQFSASNAAPAPHQPVSRFGLQGMQGGGGRPGMRVPPQQHGPGPRETDGPGPQEPPKSRVPVLEKHLVDQLSKEEVDSLTSKFQEASDADKKVQELEKEIMESKEKIEFYRTKMQELILYKSRCDNRLNEISERVSADKQEVVGLSKIYEDKCKQLGDVASRLTLEEATFRDTQEKKMEIYNTILKFHKADKDDDSAQERANKIQAELEELSKQLNDQCKTYGLRTKPTTVTELPFGWQPGILETAVEWDEEWDKFGDSGFEIIKELTIEIEKPKKETPQPENKTENKETSETANKEASSPDSSAQTKDEKTEKENSTEGYSVISTKNTVENDKKAESPKTVPSSSPSKKSPKKASNNDVFDKKESSLFNDVSPRGSGSVSEHDGDESSVSGDKHTDEHSWGPTFDHADDADSTWNFKENDLFFGGGKLGPIKTGSSSTTANKPFFDSVPSTPMSNYGTGFEPQKPSFFDSVPSTPMSNFGTGYEPQKPSYFDSVPSTPMSNFGTGYEPQKTSFFDSVPSTPMSNFGTGFEPKSSFFDSSVPSTPMSGFGTGKEKTFFDSFSPRYSEAGDDNSFDNFSNNFDSFNDNNNSNGNNFFGSQRDAFARFDSFRSTSDQGFGDSTSDQFGAEKTFSRFDSMNSAAGDAFGDSRFSRFDSMRSTADQFENKFGRFDSMKSTTDDRGFSFDENDPYGPGPAKFNESQTPRHGTDNWSSF
ncbi:hypothetical protein LUZ60_007058 [Juncus effusus]|nr:hypothetical protein LUZ60_007058 [Juncus effusus]